MVVPLLECRKRIGISTQRAFEGGRKSSPGDKEALLHRLTSFIQKLSKIRLSSMPLSSPVDIEAATNSLQSIMKEATKSKDKEDLSCCSSSLIFLIRMMPSSPELVSLVSTEYGNLVSVWSTKRKTGASLLEDLISQIPTLAKAALSSALSRATQDARTSFLKWEAYRLLSLLFENKPNPDGCSEMERLTQLKILESQDDLFNNINKTLKDEEMIPKHAKAVFKTFQKMLPSVASPASSEALDLMKAIKIQISGLGEKHKELNTSMVKLVEQIDSRLEVLKAPATPVGGVNKTKASSSSKKSKKKKKKR
jgi:hypothetical protein